MALFLCPKGLWLIRAMRGTGKAAPLALHGEGGYSLSRKRVSPLNPREKGRGAFPLDPAALAVLGLKSYAACGIGCGVRGFATNPFISSPFATAPYSVAVSYTHLGLTGKTDEDNLGFTYHAVNEYIRKGEVDPAIKEQIDRKHKV